MRSTRPGPVALSHPHVAREDTPSPAHGPHDGTFSSGQSVAPDVLAGAAGSSAASYIATHEATGVRGSSTPSAVSASGFVFSGLEEESASCPAPRSVVATNCVAAPEQLHTRLQSGVSKPKQYTDGTIWYANSGFSLEGCYG
jgi:hypothetical protein